jgi:formate hydrogenlyase subunit 3/multisubunit Na+/H+ antiporter MnhD subunit
MPVTMLMFSIGAIGICSLPPVCGIISKWYLVLGAMQAHNLAAFLVLITSSVLNILYFFPIIHTAFFEEPESGREGVREAPLSMLVPLAITAVGSILLFLAPDVAFLRLVEVAIGEVTGVLP